MSTSQAIIKFCPNCNEYDIIDEFDDYWSSMMVNSEELSNEEVYGKNFAEKWIQNKSIKIVQSFKKKVVN